MEQSYRIGIIVLNWNNSDSTIQCVESLLSSSYKDYQIVVVDNHSDDDSFSRLHAKFAAEGQIEVVQSEKNGGYAYGNNYGISHLLKKYELSHCWIINNDVIVKRATLQSFVEHAQNHPKQEMLGCTAVYSDGSLQGIGGGKLSWLTGRVVINKGTQSPVEWDYIAGSCIFFSKRVWITYGPVPEQYFMYWEDIDFCLTAKKGGISFGLVDTSVIHNEGKSWEGLSHKKRRSFADAAEKFYQKYPHFVLWRVYLFYLKSKRVLEFIPWKR